MSEGGENRGEKKPQPKAETKLCVWGGGEEIKIILTFPSEFEPERMGFTSLFLVRYLKSISYNSYI